MIDWRRYALITFHYATYSIKNATCTEQCSTSTVKCSTCREKCATCILKNVIGRLQIVPGKNYYDLVLDINAMYWIIVALIDILFVKCRVKNVIYTVQNVRGEVKNVLCRIKKVKYIVVYVPGK